MGGNEWTNRVGHIGNTGIRRISLSLDAQGLVAVRDGVSRDGDVGDGSVA